MICLIVDLYIRWFGLEGFICWVCYYDEICGDKYILCECFDYIRVLVVVSLIVVVVVSLFKGFIIFYWWSRVDNCCCYEICVCVFIFVGVCFVIVVIIFCLGFLKFLFFIFFLEFGNVFSGIMDRFFMVGVMVWGVFIIVVVCCFLLWCF